MKMKQIRKALCLLFTAGMMLCAGCEKDSGSVNYYDENNPPPTEAPVETVAAVLGEEAQVGGMNITVISAEDPDITMSQTGKKALFFQVKIDNQTDKTVTANYLNNFSLTVDGTEYDSDVCCTIPVMKELYDFYEISAMTEEIPAGESRTGYIACEADEGFQELTLHYNPKTVDVNSRVSVSLTKDEIKAVSK
ncbi:MAG: DUF4352 domain-containing protein [Oscillospiraceae bacterium]|nr:DUF4352 domain-containing protein [Oscillospiraceae bacterium]